MPSKEVRAYYLARGVCPQCGTNELKKGETICWSCRGYNRDYRRIRYERQTKAGICSACNVRPVVPGRKRCKICADMSNIKSRERYHRLREAGLCVTCGQRHATEGIFCQTCHQKSLISQERKRKRKAAA